MTTTYVQINAAVLEQLAAEQGKVAGVRVKPLEWQDFEGMGAKASAFYHANYMITLWRGRSEFEVALSYPGYQTGFDRERFHATLEAAKAAAQADYEARILAALEPAPDAPVTVSTTEQDLGALVEHFKAKAEKAYADGVRDAAKVADRYHQAAMKWAETYCKDFEGKTDSARIADEIRALLTEKEHD